MQIMKMDSFDQLQIFDKKFREKLVYEVEVWDEKTKKKTTKYELTYVGIKQLIVEMSQKGQAMTMLKTDVKRVPIDDSQLNDVWQAEVTVQNTHTKHETWGVSESAVFPWKTMVKIDKDTGKKIFNEESRKYETEFKQVYDQYGRNSAVSKAIRNAERGQLPEMSIQLFVEKALESPDKSKILNIDQEPDESDVDFCDCAGGPKTGQDGKCIECGNFSQVWWKHNVQH